MKIALIIDWFMYYTVELANALAQEHNVLLVTRDHNFEISSPEEEISLDEFLDNTLDIRVQWEKMRYRRGAISNLAEVPRVILLLKNFSPDIVHVQETTDWRILFLYKMFSRQKRILTIHDVVSHVGEGNGVLDFVPRILRRSADRIIVHGTYLKEQLQKSNYPRLNASIHVIHHGVLSIYKQWDDETIEVNEDTILFFGRLSRYKGLDILLEAHRLVLKRIPEVKLIIAGKGETLPIDVIEDNQRQHLEIHHRFIPNNEVYRFFRRASIVVLSYTEASQSGVVPIAYSFGKPVVVTNVGSIPEVVKDGTSGFIVPPNDPVALADAIIKILKNDELRRDMGKNAQEIAKAELSWAAIARQTVEVYINAVE